MSVGQRVFVFSVPEAINDAEAVSPKPEPCITDTVRSFIVFDSQARC